MSDQIVVAVTYFAESVQQLVDSIDPQLVVNVINAAVQLASFSS